MNIRITSALIVSISLLSFGCKDDKEDIDPVTASLLESLNAELEVLSSDPLQWTDNELRFLDDVSNSGILGLGEATHGSAEFFKAKHRIFRYMVENHGFKTFAIEADLGESIFINQAVLNSDKSQIETLMRQKMHFWTWRTNDVRDLLYWMCDYNVGKAYEEKVQYWGIDCQVNTYHPTMIKDNLQAAGIPFLSYAEAVLNETKTGSSSQFQTYNSTSFNTFLEKVIALEDSVVKYKDDVVSATSTTQYELTLQLVNQIRQVAEVMFYTGQSTVTKNYRDEYMAKNTAWLYQYLNESKIVLWAHNYHISDYLLSGSMGSHLKSEFSDDCSTIGFLFAKGSFTAITQEGTKFTALETQTLEEDPKPGSINDVMSRSKADVFTVNIAALKSHEEWNDAFIDGIEYFQMGAVYNNQPKNYYSTFNVNYFDRLIFFERTEASLQLQ